MKTRLNEIGEALRRKLGPLPIWAWTLIVGGALYVYRVRRGAIGDSTTATPPTDTGTADTGGGDAPGPQDPISLAPGESVYDPNSGQLVGAAPEQQDPTPPQDPVVLDPGQTVYDPNAPGIWSGGEPVPVTPAAPPAKRPRTRTPKRKVPPKQKSTGSHPAVHHVTAGTGNRSHAKTVTGGRKQAPTATHAAPKAKAHSGPKPPAGKKKQSTAHAKPVDVKPAPVRPRTPEAAPAPAPAGSKGGSAPAGTTSNVATTAPVRPRTTAPAPPPPPPASSKGGGA